MILILPHKILLIKSVTKTWKNSVLHICWRVTTFPNVCLMKRMLSSRSLHMLSHCRVADSQYRIHELITRPTTMSEGVATVFREGVAHGNSALGPLCFLNRKDKTKIIHSYTDKRR